MGVQAPYPASPLKGISLERGAHTIRDGGGGDGGERRDTNNLQDDHRGVSRTPGARREEDRGGEIRGCNGDLQHRAPDARREGHPGARLPLRRPELREGLRDHVRPHEWREAVRMAEYVGYHDP